MTHPKNTEPTGCAVPNNSYIQKFNSYSTVRCVKQIVVDVQYFIDTIFVSFREASFSGWQQENRPPFQQFDSSKQGGFTPFKPQAQLVPSNLHVPKPHNEISSYKKNQPVLGNNSFQKNPFPVSVSVHKSGSERSTTYSQQFTNPSVCPVSTPVVLAKEPTPSMVQYCIVIEVACP